MALTQLLPQGYGGRRYGDFSGKAPSAQLPPVSTRSRPFLRTVARMMGAWAGVGLAFGVVLALTLG